MTQSRFYWVIVAQTNTEMYTKLLTEEAYCTFYLLFGELNDRLPSPREVPLSSPCEVPVRVSAAWNAMELDRG